MLNGTEGLLFNSSYFFFSSLHKALLCNGLREQELKPHLLIAALRPPNPTSIDVVGFQQKLASPIKQ
jgi:hypothetical protein